MNALAYGAQKLFARRGQEGLKGTSATPGRIMAPRIVFATAAIALIIFGFLMIYSASSITGLTHKESNFDPTYYLVRQIAFAGGGLLVTLLIIRIDYHHYNPVVAGIATLIICGLLVATRLVGVAAYGAARWLVIAGFTVQPSEFAKVILVLNGAKLFCAYWADRTLDDAKTIVFLFLGIGVPLALILFQPDKGTCGIIIATLVVMALLAGASKRAVVAVGILALVIGLGISLISDYSRERILTMIDPWRDPTKNGYQLIQGFYAFGSGGLFGKGIGMSRQKYNYLPMAHNDLIFAIVGEELGFIGCVALIAVFCIYFWAGLKIAENAPDYLGRLIAAGSTSMVFIQLLLNLMGVLALFPLSGKPVPFVSYGGSSVVSSMLLAGLTLNVSMRSSLPETAAERLRSYLHIAPDRQAASRAKLRLVDDEEGLDEFGVSAAKPRSSRRQSERTHTDVRERFRVVEGGAKDAGSASAHSGEVRHTYGSALGTVRTAARWNESAGHGRKNLDDESPADRLRRRDR